MSAADDDVSFIALSRPNASIPPPWHGVPGVPGVDCDGRCMTVSGPTRHKQYAYELSHIQVLHPPKPPFFSLSSSIGTPRCSPHYAKQPYFGRCSQSIAVVVDLHVISLSLGQTYYLPPSQTEP